MTWELPDSEDRCPACGRFVSRDGGFTDVEPGGCRGTDYCEGYCDAACAERSYRETHDDPAFAGKCVCEE